MTESQQERMGIAAAVGVLALLGWAFLVLGAGPDAPAAARSLAAWCGLRAPGWTPAQAGIALGMWLAMTVAMMLPTAIPAIWTYAELTGRDRRGGHAARVALFGSGYLGAWAGFALLGTAAQLGLQGLGGALPAGSPALPAAAALLLLAAGAYQWSPWKGHCLMRCRDPVLFFMARWRDGSRGALVLGLWHGVDCIGCCWLLMALMLVGGAMNAAWMALLTLFMMGEKILPGGRATARAGGMLLCAWGAVLLVGLVGT